MANLGAGGKAIWLPKFLFPKQLVAMWHLRVDMSAENVALERSADEDSSIREMYTSST